MHALTALLEDAHFQSMGKRGEGGEPLVLGNMMG